MERSEQIGALAEALSKAQGAITGAAKGKKNPFYNSTYADLACVMEACREPLAKNGLAIIQSTQYDEASRWVETVLAHSSGQWISSRYPVKPVKDDPQGLGSAVTYARRYSLMALVGIVADDDDDGNAASGKTAGTPSVDPRPPLERPKQAATNGNGKHEDPKAAARQWVKEAEATINGFKLTRDLRAWDDNPKKLEYMARLKALDIDLFDQVERAIEAGFKRLSAAQMSA